MRPGHRTTAVCQKPFVPLKKVGTAGVIIGLFWLGVVVTGLLAMLVYLTTPH